jgi:PIN domain nuclease of toxin-antitoxin system
LAGEFAMTLLDTNVFVWLASDQGALSAAALAAIKKDRDSLFVSVVTAW